jgi:hypothetical protein
MIQRNQLLGITWLAASLLLTGCAEAPRDVSPWSRLLPSEAGQSINAMALGPQGEPAVAGSLRGDIDATATPPTGVDQGVFLGMLSDTGTDLWSTMSRGQTTGTRGVAVAPNGDVLLLGWYADMLRLGGQVLSLPLDPSQARTFLARFDPHGNLLWSQSLDGGPAKSAVIGTSLATNADGDAIVGGYVETAIDPNDPSFTQEVSGLVVRFDADGTRLWSQTLEGSFRRVVAVAADASGAVFAAGSELEPDAYDDPDQPNTGAGVFITKLSPGGEPLFTTRMTGLTNDKSPYITSLASSSSGEVVFCGGFPDDIVFGTTTFSVLRGPVAFVAKLSATGEALWLDSIEASFGRAEALAVAVGPDDRIYTTGHYLGDELTIAGLDFGPTSGTAMFLAQLDADGHATDGRIFDHAGQFSAGRALALDPAGALLLAGHFIGQIDLDDQTLRSAPEGSSFVARLALPFASHRRE